jgi:site-specific recombinase XerC
MDGLKNVFRLWTSRIAVLTLSAEVCLTPRRCGLLQTGLRLSEIIGLRCQDVALDSGPHVRCTGKGRKSRCVPLRKDTVTMLRAWLCERNAQPDTPLFPNMRGKPLSRDGVQYVLAKHVAAARQHCPSLKDKRVSPHVLRHSTAMEAESSQLGG